MDIKLDSFQTILVAVMFLVPGYIISSVLSLFTPRRTEAKELSYLRFVAFSVFNFALCWPWVMKVILNPTFPKSHPYLTRNYLLAVIFGLPLILGLLLSVVDNLRLVQRITRVFSLYAMHPTPSAWDHVFKSVGQSGARFVEVTLKDGKTVAGLYNHQAVASTDSAERDLYLIAPHLPVQGSNSEVTYQHQPRSEGILIAGSEIRAIEFLFPQNEIRSTRNVKFSKSWPFIAINVNYVQEVAPDVSATTGIEDKKDV